MLGPFNLRYVHIFIAECTAGAFILSRNGKSADFVGVSPEDLAQTLLTFRHRSGYNYFWFAPAGSAEAASALASYWYHRYRPTDNAVPPDGFEQSTWRCTIDGCTACALARQRG